MGVKFLIIDIAKIYTGFVFRKQSRSLRGGKAFSVIQVKDVSSNNRIDWERLSETLIDPKKSKELVRQGDVLVRGKGHPHLATVVDQDREGVIVGSQFFLLRADGDIILPEYLAWYINQKPAQTYLNQHSAGTNIKHVNKKVISEIPIKIPAIEIQKTVVTLYNLQLKEKELVARIQRSREKLLQAQLLFAVENRRSNVGGS